MRRFWASAVILGVVLAIGGVASGDDLGFKVIVNVSNPISSISRGELSNMFLKQEASWPDGQVILPVDQAETSSVRVDFSRVVLRRPVAAVKSFWQKQIFSGNAVPPLEKGSNEETVAYVNAFHGAIGYVGPTTPLPGGVKAIRFVD